LKERKQTKRVAPTLIGATSPAAKAPDDNVVRPATKEETFPIALIAVILAFAALVFCYTRGYLLLYGDAVAHLGIARRIFDSRNPGLSQLGGVWLPLPHLLILPFVQKMEWWQNGLAGAWPSLLCFIASVVGIYRLARRMMTQQWAFAATLFYALNPNLLYLSTTAMTEPLFLAELIWLTLFTMECTVAIREQRHTLVARRLLYIALLIVAAVFTRYDGWILGAAAWCIVTWCLSRNREVWRKVAPSFTVMTLLAIAAPLSWLAYNQHFYHDPLDFLRGPYSAAAIEKKTSPPGSRHYRGWHNPGWALLFFTRTAQVDASAWETGFAVMLAALAGLALAIRRRLALPSLLLWLPLPFYVYAIAYSSVPIFIPQLWPHSYYNARYGMELLPALAVFTFLAAEWVQQHWLNSQSILSRLFQPLVLVLIVLNTVVMVRFVPLVLKEGIVNSTTRIALETAIARELQSFQPDVPILMSTSDHIGALQNADIPLRRTLNEGDYVTWKAALDAPAEHAAYVIAIVGDPVFQAVNAHPQGLTEMTILCTTGQPCARIYRSSLFGSSPQKPSSSPR
jgi:4-amino-4-deoxy-L-arabinose transferase-like glycosyltransferase